MLLFIPSSLRTGLVCPIFTLSECDLSPGYETTYSLSISGTHRPLKLNTPRGVGGTAVALFLVEIPPEELTR
jgi:hypothetical protein